ncbi:hypothetical protein [Pseudomonas paralcaligenes]|nr:hypothetical protein [Pseudomonas paralcaligenes]
MKARGIGRLRRGGLLLSGNPGVAPGQGEGRIAPRHVEVAVGRVAA